MSELTVTAHKLMTAGCPIEIEGDLSDGSGFYLRIRHEKLIVKTSRRGRIAAFLDWADQPISAPVERWDIELVDALSDGSAYGIPPWAWKLAQEHYFGVKL